MNSSDNPPEPNLFLEGYGTKDSTTSTAFKVVTNTLGRLNLRNHCRYFKFYVIDKHSLIPDEYYFLINYFDYNKNTQFLGKKNKEVF